MRREGEGELNFESPIPQASCWHHRDFTSQGSRGNLDAALRAVETLCERLCTELERVLAG